MPPPPPAPVGVRTIAGRYRLDERAAVGGMAEVWVATDTVLDRQVAVKMLKPELAADPALLERFRREAVAVARLSHPSIVSVFDTISDDGCEAVVMELVQGRTLRAVLDAEGRLPVSMTVNIGAAIADALAVAHRARIVHRDIKPGNILLDPEGRILITDFGIAKSLYDTTDMTSDDVMMGTAKYLSPEQVLGLPVDSRSDLYSLGVVLYECLAGQPPFHGETDAATAMARIQRDPVPVRKLRPNVPRALDDLISRLLARDADDRPRNAALVRDALTRIGPSSDDEDLTTTITRDLTPDRGVPLHAGPGSTNDPTNPGGFVAPPPPRRFAALILVLCLVAAVLAGAGALLARTDTGARLFRSARQAITGKSDTPTTTVAPTTVPASPPRIVSEGEFDPPPYGDGREDPSQLQNLVDGDPTTTWSTVCYADRNLAPKKGVGVVLELSSPASGHTLVVESPTTGGWGAQVFVATKIGSTLAEWGTPVSSAMDSPPGEVRFGLGTGDGRYVLLFINQLGQSVPPCSYPYQVRIGEVSVS